MNEPWEEDLLRHQRFLLRLAARLAGPEADAQDLVQDAYVRALERPPRGGAAALRAWLATVVRRGAGRAARGAGRRAAREARVARPEAQSDVDARLSAHAELLELLRDLPEGERQALFLRYSEDLAPPEVAARLGVPLETARTRLRRGRERLRAQLTARHGRREAWIALLLPAGLRPPPCLPTAGLDHPAAPLAAQTLTTGILVGTTAKLALGAAACAAALYLWYRLDAPAPGNPEALKPASASAAEAPAELAPAQGESRRAVEAEPGPVWPEILASGGGEPAVPAAARWPLVVRAVGAPAAGARVSVQARLDAFGRYDAAPLSGVLDATNVLELDVGPHLADLVAHAGGARVAELVVELDRDDLVPAEASLLLPDPLDPAVPPERPLEVVLRLVPAALVVGRLVREDGTPFTQSALVQAHALKGTSIARESAGHARPGEDGTFRLRVDGEGPFALLGLCQALRPGTARATLARGAIVDVGDVVVARGMAIDGRAFDLAGAPAEGANVFAMLMDVAEHAEAAEFTLELPSVVAWRDGAFELFVGQCQAGPDGRFEIAGLGGHRYQLDGHAVGLEAPLPLAKPVVEAPATIELRPEAAEVRLVLRFPEGGARDGVGAWLHAGQRVEFGLQAADLEERGGVKRYALPPHATLGLVVDCDGLAPVELELETPGVGMLAVQEIVLAPLATARLTIVLRGAPVADGTPFTALIHAGGKVRDQGSSAANGRLELEGLPAGPQTIELTAGRDRFAPQGHFCSVELELDLVPGEARVAEVEVVVGGTLVLEAVGADGERLDAGCKVWTAEGAEVELVFVARMPQGRVAGEGHIFASGPSRAVPELRPGWYRAEVRAKGYEMGEVEIEIRAGATTERVVVLRRSE